VIIYETLNYKEKSVFLMKLINQINNIIIIMGLLFAQSFKKDVYIDGKYRKNYLRNVQIRELCSTLL
jgi:hypothetical protein